MCWRGDEGRGTDDEGRRAHGGGAAQGFRRPPLPLLIRPPSFVLRLACPKQLRPMPGDRRGAGVVRLDLEREPGIVGGDSVAAAELLQIGEEEAALAGELADAAVDRLVGGAAPGRKAELKRERVIAIRGIV